MVRLVPVVAEMTQLSFRNTQTGECLKALADRLYEGMNIMGAEELTTAELSHLVL